MIRPWIITSRAQIIWTNRKHKTNIPAIANNTDHTFHWLMDHNQHIQYFTYSLFKFLYSHFVVSKQHWPQIQYSTYALFKFLYSHLVASKPAGDMHVDQPRLSGVHCGAAGVKCDDTAPQMFHFPPPSSRVVLLSCPPLGLVDTPSWTILPWLDSIGSAPGRWVGWSSPLSAVPSISEDGFCVSYADTKTIPGYTLGWKTWIISIVNEYPRICIAICKFYELL